MIIFQKKKTIKSLKKTSGKIFQNKNLENMTGTPLPIDKTAQLAKKLKNEKANQLTSNITPAQTNEKQPSSHPLLPFCATVSASFFLTVSQNWKTSANLNHSIYDQ